MHTQWNTVHIPVCYACFPLYGLSSSALLMHVLCEACLVGLDSARAHLYYNKDEQPCSIMHTTAPLSSPPYHRPCVSAASYRTHTSYDGRHPRFEKHPDGGMEGRLVCLCVRCA